jgi:hypothetical protein
MLIRDDDMIPGPASLRAFAEAPGDTALPVTFLFEFEGRADQESVARIESGPFGTRSIFSVQWGRAVGPRFSGSCLAPSGDWATDHADGRRMLDVRLTFRSDDGHLVLMTYGGLILGQRIEIAPRFQADGDGPYAWMNLVQAIGFGRRNPDRSLMYRVYAL